MEVPQTWAELEFGAIEINNKNASDLSAARISFWLFKINKL